MEGRIGVIIYSVLLYCHFLQIFLPYLIYVKIYRHEIENLREKSSIQMAFSKRQKTVRQINQKKKRKYSLLFPRTWARWSLR